MRDLALRVSEAADRAVSAPAAVPLYIVVALILHLALSVDVVTLILSHFANLVLLLLAAASRRRDTKMEAEVDALADAHDGVDADALREQCQ